jgi:hypothetical protein
MTIKSFSTALLLISSLLCVVSCKKTDSDAPIVNIVTPLADDQFSGGQDIRIKGDVSDAVNLHALTIKITDDKTGTVLFSNTPAVQNLKTYTYDVTWKAKVSDWTDATVTVIAENHADIQTTKTIKIKIWL